MNIEIWISYGFHVSQIWYYPFDFFQVFKNAKLILTCSQFAHLCSSSQTFHTSSQKPFFPLLCPANSPPEFSQQIQTIWTYNQICPSNIYPMSFI